MKLEGWPRHYQTQDACAFEQHFIHEHARTSLCEKQKQLEMLCPCVDVYQLPTKNFAREQNVAEKETEVAGNNHPNNTKTSLIQEKRKDTLKQDMPRQQNPNDKWKTVQATKATQRITTLTKEDATHEE